VGRGDRRAQPRAAGRGSGGRGVAVQERQLAHRQREVLCEPVVHVGGDPQPLALDRRALELQPQLSARDPRCELVAE
jgi:hypothetical protein